jgi:oxalate decarboxylase/phosphoglucose isomerase-like protein (cupin superfamily)
VLAKNFGVPVEAFKNIPVHNKWIYQTQSLLFGVRRGKAALSSGCKSHPANAPAGSNRSSHGGNEVAEAFG